MRFSAPVQSNLSASYSLQPKLVNTKSGRKTYGHSIIISPWGEVLAEADGLQTTVIYANIETETLATVRDRVPSFAS